MRKKIFYSCSSKILLFCAFLFLYQKAETQVLQKEVRAVWLTTVDYLDWPSLKNISNVSAQKKSLISILDNLQKLNFNTIYFQVRPRGNAFYKSNFEPWATELTGTLGKDPGWDPLEFIIFEANKRGMEIHAWINVVKVWSGTSKPSQLGKEHILNKNANWFKLYENEWWIDFGYPEARTYTFNVVKDILTNYEIDGLHFDFLRYPGETFDDEESYKLYGSKSVKEDWRRNNINIFLKSVKDLVVQIKPYVKVGAAPIGIYKNTKNIYGLSSYENLFQDTKYWLDNNLVDYIAPQTYWDIRVSKRDPGFGLTVKEWNRLKNNKSIYPGIGLWRKSVQNELREQIDICRKEQMEGFSIYRYTSIDETPILKKLFPLPAQIPAAIKRNESFDGKDILVSFNEMTNELVWKTYKENVKFFNIYEIYNNKKTLIKIVGKNVNSIILKKGSAISYGVSYSTKYNNESPLYLLSSAIVANNEPFNKDNIDLSKDVLKKMLKDPIIVDIFNKDISFACYPNPFDNYLLIGYEIKEKMDVDLSVLTLDGKEVIKILKGQQDEGNYVLKAEGSDFEKGRYIINLKIGNLIKQKLVIKN
jgi:uncharacterized lipoprotein YddW (UPF0748 family)